MVLGPGTMYRNMQLFIYEYNKEYNSASIHTCAPAIGLTCEPRFVGC